MVGSVLFVNGFDLGLGQLSVEMFDEFGLVGNVRELDRGPLLAVLSIVHHLNQDLRKTKSILKPVLLEIHSV